MQKMRLLICLLSLAVSQVSWADAASLEAEIAKIGGMTGVQMRDAGIRTSARDFTINDEDVWVRIDTIDSFLQYVDLRKAHLSRSESGAPGMFIAVPKVAMAVGETSGAPGKKVDGIGYYFKGRTNLTVDGPYDDSVDASPGTTGGGWSCGTYTKSGAPLKAKLDVLDFNEEKVKAATDPLSKLKALTEGYRFTAMEKGNAIQTGCTRTSTGAVWKEDFSIPFGTSEVQTYAIFKAYKEGDYLNRKADAIDVYGASFGGHFVWERTENGKVANAQMLIDLYTDLGYTYVEAGSTPSPAPGSSSSDLSAALNDTAWSGTYDVKYVAATATGFSSESASAWRLPTPMPMDISFKATPAGLVYNWDRAVRSSGETDDKTCNGGKMLPRQVNMLSDLMAAAAAKGGAVAAAAVEAKFDGIQAKLGLSQPVVGLISGKKCKAGVVGEDLKVPVIKVELSDDGKALSMTAVLGPNSSFGSVAMGYSFYEMTR